MPMPHLGGDLSEEPAHFGPGSFGGLKANTKLFRVQRAENSVSAAQSTLFLQVSLDLSTPRQFRVYRSVYCLRRNEIDSEILG